MEAAIYKFNKIVIAAKRPKKWKENLQDFEKYFLGDGPYASGCKLINPEVLDFSKKSDTLFAKTVQPLIVINNALGGDF